MNMHLAFADGVLTQIPPEPYRLMTVTYLPTVLYCIVQ